MVIVDIINYQVLGNELWRYLLFVGLLLVSFPVSKGLNHILNNHLKKWATKTSFKLDDILFDSVNPSLTMFVFAGAFYLAYNQLNLGSYTSVFLKLFNFLIIIPLVYFLIKFSTETLGFYLKGDGAKRKRINEAAIDLLMQIIRITLFVIGLLLILGNLGYDVSALLAGLGVGGLAFALAAQDLLKNFFAGISLIFDKAFGKGERVNFENYSGRIEELRLRSTKLRTYDGTLITIPNSKLADGFVENVTKVPRVKVKMNLGVTYDTSSKKIKEAKKIIQKILKKNKYADEESASIWFDSFGDFSLNIQVIYYAKELTMDNWNERIAMKEEINLSILEEFEKAGIEFAYPTQTIELKK
jgi:MscS family membrane protein